MDDQFREAFSNHSLDSQLPASFLNQNRQPTIIAENVFMCVLAITAVALRFYARKASRAGFWWDDWVTLMALPYSLAINIFSAELITVGQGVHLVTILHANPSPYFKQLYFEFVIYAPSLVFFKIAMLLFYVRLFPHHRWLKVSSWVLGVAIGIWLVIVECLIIFACNPIRRTWDRSVPGTCMDRGPIFIAQSIPTVIFDLIILALAVPLVWGVQLPRTSRIALIGIFMMGGLVTVISIVRLTYALKPVSSDFTWNYVDLSLWSDTEAPIGLLSVCLPTYGGLFRKFLERLHITRPVPCEITPASEARGQASQVRQSSRVSTPPMSDVESAAWFKELGDAGDHAGSGRKNTKSGFIVVTKDIKVLNGQESGRGSCCECSGETPTTPKSARRFF